MKTLHYNNINTKKKLFELYINQLPERDIRYFINEIIEQTRPQKNKFSRQISVRELLTFIDYYGLPIGFGSLSAELQQAQTYLQKK